MLWFRGFPVRASLSLPPSISTRAFVKLQFFEKQLMSGPAKPKGEIVGERLRGQRAAEG